MDPIEMIKLLYIEDDEQHAILVTEMLKKSKRIKFDVKHKGDLKSGLAYLKSIDCNIDAVLLDLVLPNSSGVATFQKVYDACINVPIIIISGYEDIACKCISLGAQDYLVKPDISTQLLSKAIKYSIERKKLLMKIKYSEERFKRLSDASFEGITITKDGVFIDSNAQFAEMVGCTVDEVIGSKVTKFVFDEYRELVLNNIATKHERPYEHIAQRKDGTLFPVEIHGQTLPDGLRLTAVRNMERYKENEDSLKCSEKKYRELIEISRAAVYEIDFRTNRFVYVNDYLCEHMGYTREEFLSMDPKDILTKKSYEEFIERIELLSQGKHITNEFEYSAKTKSGELIWVIITATYKEDNDGNIIGAKVIAIDITETKKMKYELEKKEEHIFNQLEKKIQDWKKEMTLKNIAHEDKLKAITLDINSMSQAEVQ